MKKSTMVALGCGAGAVACIALAVHFKKRRQTGGAVACGVVGGCAAAVTAGCTVCALRKREALRLEERGGQSPRITRLSDTSTRNASGQGIRSTERQEMSVHDKITQAVQSHMSFTSENAMACDVFVTKVLLTAHIKPKDWPDPNWTTVKGYRSYMKNDLSPTASKGWNIVVMISDNPTIELNGQIYATDQTPHMGLVDKQKDGSLVLYHYTKGKVKVQEFKCERDFVARMPYEVYSYDTAEYKSLE